MREVTEVAVGVLIDKEGRFLMASRPQGKLVGVSGRKT